MFSNRESVLIRVPRTVADRLKLVIYSWHRFVSRVHLDVVGFRYLFLLHVAGAFRTLIRVVIAVGVDKVGIQAVSSSLFTIRAAL